MAAKKVRRPDARSPPRTNFEKSRNEGRNNAKAPGGGFRLMIAMRCGKTALVDRSANPLARAAISPIGGMSNRDRLVVRRTVAFASPACTIEACRIRRAASSAVRYLALWI